MFLIVVAGSVTTICAPAKLTLTAARTAAGQAQMASRAHAERERGI